VRRISGIEDERPPLVANSIGWSCAERSIVHTHRRTFSRGSPKISPGGQESAQKRSAMPVQTVTLDGVDTTVLGFGCANLFRLSGPAQRADLLEAVYEAGVRHFDVAPMYGLGLAEREVGRFVRKRRHNISIATKFGIKPTAVANGLARIQGPARRAFEASPMLRQRARSSAAGPGAGRLGALLYSAEAYVAAGAKRSLERSLRALGTDYVDLLLLHDPAPGTVRSEELYSYLHEARRSGKIRSWGIAGEAEPTIKVARSFGYPVPVLQLRDDIFLRSLRNTVSGTGAFITFGLLGGALARLVNYVSADDERRKRWNGLTGVDCGEPEAAASLLLRAAFRENRSGVVLFSTIRSHRILDAVAAAEARDAAADRALDAFLDVVDVELRAGQSKEEERT
jgi:D-threo-aldose 1-dehydrogenase